VLETLPTNSTAKQEAGVRRSAGLTVIVVRDELGAAGRNGVEVIVAICGSLYKENNKHTTSPHVLLAGGVRARIPSETIPPERVASVCRESIDNHRVSLG